MIDSEFARHFGLDWIESWNDHDLLRILSHYAEDFEMISPVIVKIAEEPTGTLKGKKAVGSYWKKALDLIPDLKFELIDILTGVNSVTILYQGPRGLSAEIFFFGTDRKATKAVAHYAGEKEA